jgi:predicted dehydrogenase
MAPVRYGVIGSGAMGGVYCAVLTNGMTHDGTLVAVAGGSRAPALAARHTVDAEATPERLIARRDLDCVVIATPPSTHMPLTVESARAGKHVLVEKPMARSVGECDAMIAACREAGVVLAVNKLTRYRDTTRELKRLIDAGTIGEVRMIRVQLTRAGLEENLPGKALGGMGWIRNESEGTEWLDWGCHACDMLRFLTGSEPTLAFAQFADYRLDPTPPLHRSGMSQYTFANGVLAQIWMSSELPPPGLSSQTEYVVAGADGILAADMYGKLMLGRNGTWTTAAEQAPFDYVRNQWDPVRLAGWARQVDELTRQIADDGTPGVTGEDGRAAIAMVEAAERSAAAGTAIRLPLELTR